MSTSDATKPLAGKIALVAGATRGAGRGIATMLGTAGATVICTGRSTRGNPATAGRPETIEETAELVTAAGGVGVAIRVDHTVADDVRALFDRVERDFQRLDVLVNDIWGGDELSEWGKPFWKLDPAKGLKMQELAVQTHILTARFGAPMMVRQKSGLIIEITDGMHLDYRGNLFYDLAKISAIRLAYAMAVELRRHNVVALALTPGFLRSEAMLDGFGVTEANWRDAVAKNPDFAESETPAYVGRAVVALATDANVAAKAGKVCSSWTLAREYGFRDADGRQPDWGGYFERMVNAILDRGGPSNRDEQLRVWSRYEQIRNDQEKTEEAARLVAALNRAGVSILP
ncbi:MAG TPA: SDR family oxidoreductase [Candidatus Binatus sp.]|uniref:SDR family oxidoreductase n=1 Tax=Candidatus Binatus sp. TaxID=2811406 RepID=UPI002F4172C1